jgi:uncharacterized protein (DUF362 family)
MKTIAFSRRTFLHRSLAAAAGVPLALRGPLPDLFAADSLPIATARRDDAKVALVRCRTYGPEVKSALAKSFDLLGGIGSLVKGKTVTVKINLTGTDFAPYLGRPVGETFMTHETTARALISLLFAAEAKRVRIVESTQSRADLATSLKFADWDLKAFEALGAVEFENTRNLGTGKGYAHLTVPGGGYMFSSFDLNHAYADTDVMVSLCKLKQHVTAGVTLSMKNLFGITPNSLYGSEAGSEEATGGRGPLHGHEYVEKLPGLKAGISSQEGTWRVPNVVADICAARPVHLAIIDGITSVSGGEGNWVGDLKAVAPGVIIAGLNCVSTDAVGVAVMGYANPRAPRGAKPFHFCENHLLLAEKAGTGMADLAQIDVRGLTLPEARFPYADLF